MPRKKPEDRFLSCAEVAALIGLAEGTIRSGGCGTDELLRIKLSGRVVFSANNVRAWMASKVKKAEEDQMRSRMAVLDMLEKVGERARQKYGNDPVIIDGYIYPTTNGRQTTYRQRRG
jgi:predicted DNA-binding transcriptional regulator AlpA